MKPIDIAEACAALANQAAAGIAITPAVKMMASLQPKYSATWLEIERETARGTPLSKCLEPIWPTGFVAMVRAGEEAGSIDKVLKEIDQSIGVRQKAFGVLNRIYYPIITIIGGVSASIFFLAFVIPSMVKSLAGGGGATTSPVLAFGIALNTFITTHITGVATIAAMAIGAFVLWIYSGRAGSDLQSLMLRMPMVKLHVSKIFYAVWAKTLATMTAAGIPIMAAIPLSIPSLPPQLQPSVRRIQLAIERNSPLGTCANAEMVGDDRERLPAYIVNAFKVAGETGDLADQLNRAAPILIDESTRAIIRSTNLLVNLATIVSGFIAIIPIAAYYQELFSLVKRVL